MTAPSGDPKPDLQFDAAEPAAPRASASRISCSNCQKPITTTYHTFNAAILCSPCRGRIEREVKGGGSGRMGGALLWGAGGALAGAIVYYITLAVTDYNIGLIAIGVGWLVGRGIQKGSGGIGGVAYQALAVALTWFAVAGAFLPLVIKEIRQADAQEAAADSSGADESVAALVKDDIAAEAAEEDDAEAEAAAAEADSGPLAGTDIAAGFMGVLMFMAILPIVANGPIGWLIVGYGLYQAWKMNKAVPLDFAGPFKVGGPAPA